MGYTKLAKTTGVINLSGVVIAGPFAVEGCERVLGYPEARCQDLSDAAQNLPKWFISTSTATNSL